VAALLGGYAIVMGPWFAQLDRLGAPLARARPALCS
jgi:hypothetical protein